MRRFFALDPAGSQNSFTAACVGQEDGDPCWYVLGVWAEKPSAGHPLNVAEIVVPKMARRCLAMGCDSWMSDAHEYNSVLHVGIKHGISTRLQGGTRVQIWGPLKRAVAAGRLKGSGPAVAEALRQAALIREARTPSGELTLHIPSEGAEHCDEAAALARALLFARAGEEIAPLDLAATNAGLPYYTADAGRVVSGEGESVSDPFAPTW